MNRLILPLLSIVFLAAAAHGQSAAPAATDALLIVGASGEDRYAARFQEWAATWQTLCRRAEISHRVIGFDLAPLNHDLEQVRQWCEQAARLEGSDPLWMILIGHGTFDGRSARFSMRGPDLSAAQLAAWIKPIRRPIVIVNTASCSGPFLTALSGPGRIVITATRSGSEQSSTRFAGFFFKALDETSADLDGDRQISILEAFLAAARDVDLSYRQEGLLASEHAMIDDNGDGKNSRSENFSGLEPLRTDTLDGAWARQVTLIPSEEERQLPAAVRTERDRLERELSVLKRRRQELDDTRYFEELEKILSRIGRLYAQTPDTP